MRTNRRRRGFTLIELLLVMVILAVLAALVLPKFTGRAEDANKSAAGTQINSLFSVALDMYEADNGRFPSTAQGLEALRTIPTAAPEPKNWKGYLKSDVPNDPWGNPYIYRNHGAGVYELVSYGADGSPGGAHDDASEAPMPLASSAIATSAIAQLVACQQNAVARCSLRPFALANSLHTPHWTRLHRSLILIRYCWRG